MWGNSKGAGGVAVMGGASVVGRWRQSSQCFASPSPCAGCARAPHTQPRLHDPTARPDHSRDQTDHLPATQGDRPWQPSPNSSVSPSKAAPPMAAPFLENGLSRWPSATTRAPTAPGSTWSTSAATTRLACSRCMATSPQPRPRKSRSKGRSASLCSSRLTPPRSWSPSTSSARRCTPRSRSTPT
ncbi:hypothetical protein D3C72_1530120 [compost metagenome]